MAHGFVSPPHNRLLIARSVPAIIYNQRKAKNVMVPKQFSNSLQLCSRRFIVARIKDYKGFVFCYRE